MARVACRARNMVAGQYLGFLTIILLSCAGLLGDTSRNGNLCTFA